MRYQPISFTEKFALFDEQWQPKVVAEMRLTGRKLMAVATAVATANVS